MTIAALPSDQLDRHRRDAGPSHGELWPRHFALGGVTTAPQVRAVLYGDLPPHAHTPRGGGLNKEQQTTTPAWDVQDIIPRYDILTDYSFSCRLAYRPRCSREEVIKEYEGWKKELG